MILDIIFLWIISNKVSKLIFQIQGSRINLNIWSSLVVYVFICMQIYYFIFINNASLMYAFILGASTYGIYEFTNMSILKHWDYRMAIIDTLWGGVLYTSTTYIIRNIMSDSM